MKESHRVPARRRARGAAVPAAARRPAVRCRGVRRLATAMAAGGAGCGASPGTAWASALRAAGLLAVPAAGHRAPPGPGSRPGAGAHLRPGRRRGRHRAGVPVRVVPIRRLPPAGAAAPTRVRCSTASAPRSSTRRTFRGILLGLLLHQGLSVPVWPSRSRPSLYGVATRLWTEGRSRGCCSSTWSSRSWAAGWSSRRCGIGAAVLGHAITRFGVFLATGHTRPGATGRLGAGGGRRAGAAAQGLGPRGRRRDLATAWMAPPSGPPGFGPSYAGQSPFAPPGYGARTRAILAQLAWERHRRA